MRFLISLLLLLSPQAFAGGSDVQTLFGAQIQNGTATLSLPVLGGTLVSNNNTIGLINKTIDGSFNTLLNLPTSAFSGQVSVPNGGTGLATLTLNGVLFGNGVSPAGVTAAGTQYQLLQAGAGGVPAFDAVHLDQPAAVTGALPIPNGGTNSTTANGALNNLLPVQTGSAGYFLATDGSNTAWTPASSAGANRFLSNLLSPTSVNQDLIFNTGFLATLKTQDDVVATQGLNILTGDSSGAGSGSIFLSSGLPSGGISGSATVATGPASGSDSTGMLVVSTGNVVDGTSGDVNISAGTVSGVGSRGTVFISGDHIDAGNNVIRNLSDPVGPQDGATKNYVDTSTGIGGQGSATLPILIDAGTGVNFVSSSPTNVTFIAGDGAPVVVTATPQVSPASTVRQMLTLIGEDDTNTVTLADGNGLSLNGTWVAGQNSVLTLIWDGSVWVESSRR